MNPNTKLAVLVYIYGGRLAFGAARQYAADFLLEKNVIVVSNIYIHFFKNHSTLRKMINFESLLN